MSDLSKLARVERKEDVKGHKISIMPLGVSDMALLEKDNMTDKETLTVVKDLIKKSIPGSTDEEIDNMSMEYMLELQEAIMKVNDMTGEKIVKLKEKQKLVAELKKK